MDIFVCRHCADLTPRTGSCLACGQEVTPSDRLEPGRGLGLIGAPNTGKTCLLAAMHDQLMHAAPEWRVEVSDWAFDKLTDDYWAMCQGNLPQKTQLEGPDQFFFSITVDWHGARLPLLMKDMGGEYTFHMADVENPTSSAACRWDDSDDEDHLDRGKIYLQYLAQCKSVLVAVGCWDMQEAIRDEQGARRNLIDHDREMGRLFRGLLRVTATLKHVAVVLVGVDVYGRSADDAIPRAVEEFEGAYRAFPGVLKNAGILVDTVAVSNIGFGNERFIDPTTGIGRFRGVPQPFEILEPLRRSLVHYLPEKVRRNIAAAPRSTPRTSPRADSDSHGAVRQAQEEMANGSGPTPGNSAAKRRRAFLSYRRESGADTARVIRASLASHGWDAFLDVEDLGSSYFDDRLLLEIKRADAFIVVLAPGALDRCREPDDWLRREISHAIKWRKKIIPVTKPGFAFSASVTLPAELADLPRHNCIEYSHQYFQAMMHRLLTFLDDQGAAPIGQSGGESPEIVRWRCRCGHAMRAHRKHAGRAGKCPFCGREQRVPNGTSTHN